MRIKSSQLALIPYPKIIDAIATYQKITKGNARKRQLGYISRQLRKLELSDVRAIALRFDSSSPEHKTLIAKLEHYRTRLIESDAEVVAEISDHFPTLIVNTLCSLLGRLRENCRSHKQSLRLTRNPGCPPHPSARLDPLPHQKRCSLISKHSPINTSL